MALTNYVPYDYAQAVSRDIDRYLRDSQIKIDFDDLDALTFRCEMSDEITGNASGSYTMDQYKAQVCLLGNFGLLKQASDDIYPGFDYIKEGPESADVIIRIHLVRKVLPAVLDELKAENAF